MCSATSVASPQHVSRTSMSIATIDTSPPSVVANAVGRSGARARASAAAAAAAAAAVVVVVVADAPGPTASRFSMYVNWPCTRVAIAVSTLASWSAPKPKQ